MMSAILGTLFILGRKCQTRLLLLCLSLPVPRSNKPSPGCTHAPQTAQTTGNSAQLANRSVSRPPKPPTPRQAPLPAHALPHKGAADPQETGTPGSLGDLSPAARAPRPPPRGALPLQPAQPSPAGPSTRFLDLPGLGPCSPPRRRRGGWWAPPRRSWARPSWPPSGPERSWTSPSPWRGLGRPRRAAAGSGRGLRAPGCNCSLYGRAPRAAPGGWRGSGSSAAAEAATAVWISQPPSSRARAETARTSPGRRGGGGGGASGRGRGAARDPALAPQLGAGSRRASERDGCPCGPPGISSSEFAPNQVTSRPSAAGL